MAQFPVVVLTGARQVGKSTLSRMVWPQADYVSLDSPSAAALARESPEQFFAGRRIPLIIDEVQYVPEIFRHIKQRIDLDRTPGQLLLTGSQAFSLMAGVGESLAGRAAVLALSPLMLEELTIETQWPDLDQFTWRGGFPELWARPELDRDLWLGSYVATYLERDVRAVLNVSSLRDFDRFLRAAALRVGQLISYVDLGGWPPILSRAGSLC